MLPAHADEGIEALARHDLVRGSSKNSSLVSRPVTNWSIRKGIRTECAQKGPKHLVSIVVNGVHYMYARTFALPNASLNIGLSIQLPQSCYGKSKCTAS